VNIKKFQYQGTRNYQQDNYYTNEDRGIYIICDGVGGSVDGAKASEIVTLEISDYLINATEAISVQYMEDAIYSAQQQLNKYADENLDFGNSGTTLALLVLNGEKAYAAHMGDSKILLFKQNSNKIWYTKDHSMVQELFEAGVIKNEADLFTHPMRNRITNGLFARKEPRKLNISITELSNINKGDIFIICSDGVFESYRPLELYQLYNQESVCKATEIIEKKVESASSDNSTFILVQI
jgi:protein phosphatase